jgi:hypothetical protein
MAEWSEDHVTAIGSLNLTICLIGGILFNWRPSGALRWKVETVDWEDWGVVSGKPTPPRL